MLLTALAIYISGMFLIGPLVLMIAGGPESPLARNLAGFVCTVIWVVSILHINRSSKTSVWRWGQVSKSQAGLMILYLIAYITVVGLKKENMTQIVSSLGKILRPGESLALDACVFAPIREEFFWRGLVMRSLSEKIGLWPSLVVSSLLFGSRHSNIKAATTAGLIAGFLYSPKGAGNLLVNILFHMFANLKSKGWV